MKQHLVPALALIAFNRPDLLRRQLEIVRAHFRGRIFAIVDGPRADKPGEDARVEEVVRLFEALKDEFPVEIHRSGTNLGCRRRVSSGLTWVFSQVERAIILEDDCFPRPEFFTFCEAMLERYVGDTRIFTVTGTNLLGDWKPSAQDYHFSHYGSIWGWATWRRAWNHYDDSMKLFGDPRAKAAISHLFPRLEAWKRLHYCRLVSQGRLSSWGYVWSFTRHINSALTVVPSRNLVENVGFREDSTHTSRAARRLIQKTADSFPRSGYRENPFVVADRGFDRRLFWKQSPLRLGPIMRFVKTSLRLKS